MLFQQTVGGSYSATAEKPPNAVNERIFRVARNSYTKTATITAASFVRGNPAVLATETASNNGYDIKHADTAGANIMNNLLIGVVYDYPDTTVGRAGVWQPEDVGIVQCYGLNTNVVGSIGTVSMAPGLMMVPNTGSMFLTCVGPVTAINAGNVSTDSHTELCGSAGLIILASAVASSSASGTTQVTGFIRCM